MKKSILLVLSCVFIFSNCSDSETPIPPENVKYLWHLVNVTGGIAGIGGQFSLDTVVWEFNDATSKLKVTNNNDDNSIEDSLDSGTYSFSVLNKEGETYLIVDDNELGNFVVSQNQNSFTLNQNKMSAGNGADGFIYTFKRTVVVID